MSTYVLVHGAWMGQFAWAAVRPGLEAKGHTVITLDLPAHGDDQTPAEAASLDSYRDAVIAAIGARQEIVLVGHSFGGVVISAVAEAIPDQIKTLIYLAAYLPRSGESLYQLSQEDSASHVGPYWRQDDPARYTPATIAAEGIVEVFGADCAPADQALLVERHRAEPVPPLATPVVLSEARYGRVARAYIETLHDNAVSHLLQSLMLSRSPIERRAQLATSHSPFFSAPAELVAALVELA
jgi:pimeloyl-ACP methyl ester carboxylesterase